jgi:xylose isomerase
MSSYKPKKSDRFTFGLWTIGNRGGDPFGEATRPRLDPIANIKELGRRNVYGFNYHDDDLIPFGSTLQARNKIIRETKKAMADYDIRCAMATTNLFFHKVFKDGAFTSHDPRVRAFALQKVMINMELAAELGAKVYVFWGGREGTECDASKTPDEMMARYRECMNYLCEHADRQGYEFTFAIEPKPNEPRGDIFLATTGHVLGLIATLDHPERVGVNPEIQHTRMAGLNTYHDFGQALEAGKLFHADLGAQKPSRFDQDMRFGSEDLKDTFFIVKLLEDHGWPLNHTRAFDCHPYRNEDEKGVWDFVEGCMRSYLILKDKVAVFNKDTKVQQILKAIHNSEPALEKNMSHYSAEGGAELLAAKFNPELLSKKSLPYEELDQRLQEILLGVK